MTRTALLAMAMLIAMTSGVLAQDETAAQRAFFRGNDLFEKGDFEAAVEAYSEALEKGSRSPALHFNLGNAWLRLERPGHAIHQFRLARELAPRDGDIAANLAVAHERAELPAPEERSGIFRALFFVHERLTRTEALFLFAALWLLGFGLLHARLLWRRPRGLILPLLLIILGAAVLTSLAIRSVDTGRSRTAIVVAPTAPAWSGRSEESFGKLFELPEGQEVEVLESDENWIKIAAGTRKGYVRRAQLREL